MPFRVHSAFRRSPISIVAAATRPAPRISQRSIVPLGLGLCLSYSLFPGTPSIRFDNSPGAPFSSSSAAAGRRNSNPFSSGSGKGRGDGPLGMDPKTVKQITTGSVIGLVTGLAFSMFSRTLTIVLGLSVLGIQYLSTKGIRILPVEKLQKYVKNVDLRKWLESNPALKISFGVTFILAAFGYF